MDLVPYWTILLQKKQIIWRVSVLFDYAVLSEIERRYIKKDVKLQVMLFLPMKEKDFSIPMFTEAFEQYGLHLEEGKIV